MANLAYINSNILSDSGISSANVISGSGTNGYHTEWNGTNTIYGVINNTAFNVNFETTATNIKMDGAASVGSLGTVARADHVHPSDTSREPAIGIGTTAQYWRGDKTWQTLDPNGVLTTADASKNVLSATKLTTARTINGVSFDGTANITVADSTKEPAIAGGTTAQYWRGDKSWQTLDPNAVLTTADASKNVLSATKLTTARTINGVSFDGTANITIADSTKVPTTTTISTNAPLAGGGSLSGNLTLSIPQANGSTNGYLASGDWTTFNNKQNTITNPVTGTGGGTTNTIPKFNGVNAITNSNITDNGTIVTVATDMVIGGGGANLGTGPQSHCYFFGALALNANAGPNNTAMGYASLYRNTTGQGVTAYGFGTLDYNVDGSYSVALGYNAGASSSGGNLSTANNSIFIGSNTKSLNSSTTNEIVIGDSVTGNGSNTATIGNASITDNYFKGNIRATKFMTQGGSATQFVKGDGTLDGNTYALSSNINGTTNVVPKFTGTNTIGNSIITDNGAAIGLGNNVSINYTPDINGALKSLYGPAGATPVSNIASLFNPSTTTGVSNGLVSFLNVQQSSTAGYRGLWITSYEQTVGSGVKYLIDAGTNTSGFGGGTYTSKFNLDSSGNMFVYGNVGVNMAPTTDDLSVSGTVVFNGLVNGGVATITMPAMTNAPGGGTPDAVVIYNNGHNGTGNQTSALGLIIANNKCQGMYVDGGSNATNSIGYQVIYPANSTTNTVFMYNKGGGNTIYKIDDQGATTAPANLYTSVTALGSATAPFRTPSIGVSSSSFIPMWSQAAFTTGQGYVSQLNVGLYKNAGGSWAGSGMYVAIGGNDNNPTENFTMLIGGDITHSSGSKFLNTSNYNSTMMAVPSFSQTSGNAWNGYNITQYKFGFWDVMGANWMPTTGASDWYWGMTVPHSGNGPAYNYGGQIAFYNTTTDANVYVRTISDNSGNPITSGWRKLVHNNNLNSFGIDTTWRYKQTSGNVLNITTENIQDSYLIPANTITAVTSIEITTTLMKTSGGSGCILKVYLNTTNAAGGTVIFNNTSINSFAIKKKLLIINSGNIYNPNTVFFNSTVGALTDEVSFTQTSSGFTTTVDNYIVVTTTKSSGADRAYVAGTLIRMI